MCGYVRGCTCGGGLVVAELLVRDLDGDDLLDDGGLRVVLVQQRFEVVRCHA